MLLILDIATVLYKYIKLIDQMFPWNWYFLRFSLKKSRNLNYEYKVLIRAENF